MTERSAITDAPFITGTPHYISSQIQASNKAPERIINLWIDPISDDIRCTLALHYNPAFGELVHDFDIVLAEGATFTLGGWQPLGDPIPLWSYPGRNTVHHLRFPAPEYYQPIIRPVQSRATHLTGTQHWVPLHAPTSVPRPSHQPLRLVPAAMLEHVLRTRKNELRPPFGLGPMMPYDYEKLRVATKAPPWHLAAGCYALAPLSVDPSAAGPAASVAPVSIPSASASGNADTKLYRSF